MQLLLQLLMLMLIQFLQQLLLQLLLRDRDCAPLYSFSHCERNPCRPLMDLAKVFAALERLCKSCNKDDTQSRLQVLLSPLMDPAAVFAVPMGSTQCLSQQP